VATAVSGRSDPGPALAWLGRRLRGEPIAPPGWPPAP
jgi:hypothetical protein